MKRQDILSIGITFGMGFVAGIYLYISGFAGFAAQFAVGDQESVNDFVIVADAYGGCRADCPSFQVQSNGEYRYLYAPQVGAEQVIREGTLPLNVRRELRAAVTTRELASQSRSVGTGACASDTDRIDAEYRITVEGEEYVIDSCRTNVDSDSDLWQALNAVWTYFGSF